MALNAALRTSATLELGSTRDRMGCNAWGGHGTAASYIHSKFVANQKEPDMQKRAVGAPARGFEEVGAEEAKPIS
ncbi:hypothetical protein N7470_002436 [Penicillium chermesinum]|nr:hypothetical protein N7470_002436 [Penicillium chermesinum]